MNIVQTALVFAGIPLAVIGLLTALIYGPAGVKAGATHRPGKEWGFAPLWYLPHAENTGSAAHSAHDVAAIEGAPGDAVLAEAVGGASGEW